MVVPGPLAWEPLPPPPRRRWLRWAVPTAVLALLLAAAAEITLPYYALSPGSATGVSELIRVPRGRSFPPRGQVLFATVSLSSVNTFEAIRGWLDPDTAIVTEERILGPTRRRDFSRQNLQLMDASKQLAAVVALRRLGFEVPEEGTGGLVIGVEGGSPAEGRLAPGDVITAVDGRPTPLRHQVIDGIRARRPGETVRLDVQDAKGRSRVEEVGLARRRRTEDAFLGVVLQTKEHRFQLPFEVVIDSGTVGGNSAGLAFTLGVLDTLTSGELTGGKRVAVTGTIEIDGSVGDVGGVAQKTAAVRAARAEVFLVPPGEFDEATRYAGGSLEVIKVANLDQALAALARLGGDVSALGPAPREAAR